MKLFYCIHLLNIIIIVIIIIAIMITVFGLVLPKLCYCGTPLSHF